MKKSVLIFAITAILLLNFGNVLSAQDQPTPKKDTVNIDTEAKPTFYYAVEDEENAGGSGKGTSATIFIVIGAVVVLGAAGFFLLKKKK